ncbi:MAG: O-antigen ligase family protein [Geobacter sp.]|nr:O-antigen ligase family protein [Geobacter sp.]
MTDSTDSLRKLFGWITVLYASVVSTIKPAEGVFGVLLLLLGGYLVWRKKTIEAPLRIYSVLLFMYLIANVASLVFSDSSGDVGLFVLKNILVFISVFVAVNIRDARLLYAVLTVFCLGVCILACVTVYDGLILGVNAPRPPSFMTAVHAGYILSYGLLVVLVSYMHIQRYRFGVLVVVMMLSVALMLNATRGAWIATVLALVPIIIRSRIKFWFLGLIVLVLLLLFSLPQVRLRTLNDIHAVLHYSYGSPIETSMGAKLDMWVASYTLFKQSPFFGVGANKWQQSMHVMIENKQASEVLRHFNQPHNMFVYALATTGAVGVVVFVLFVAFPYYFLKRYGQQRTLFSDLLSVLIIAFIVQGQFDSVPQMYRPFQSYLFLTGVCMAGITWAKRDDRLLSKVLRNRCVS